MIDDSNELRIGIASILCVTGLIFLIAGRYVAGLVIIMIGIYYFIPIDEPFETREKANYLIDPQSEPTPEASGTAMGPIHFLRYVLAFVATATGVIYLIWWDHFTGWALLIVSVPVTYPLDSFFFPPDVFIRERAQWPPTLLIVLRNTGICLCLAAAYFGNDEFAGAPAILLVAGVALLVIPRIWLFIVISRTKDRFIQRQFGKKTHSDTYLTAYAFAEAPPKSFTDEAYFDWMIRHFRTSWLRVNNYHERLFVHREPQKFQSDVSHLLWSYQNAIGRRNLLWNHNYNKVIQGLTDIWKSDRRIRSLFKTIQIYSRQTRAADIYVLMAHIAEYRAVGQLIRIVKRSIPKPPEKLVSFATETRSQLPDTTYFQIIDYIVRLGKNLERVSRLNAHLDEELYRDYFQSFLNAVSPHYTAKGEAFNKKGKTDILVEDRDGNSIFIAECKLWKGQSHLLDGVDQLLEQYVCWRDEKTAVIVFNREVKNFTALTTAATAALSQHRLCRQAGRKRTDFSWSYLFRHPDDEARIIKLELILLNCVY